MRCIWCDNPESQQMRPLLTHWPERCIRCGTCAAVCPSRAIVEEAGQMRVLADRCDLCGRCQAECYSGAIELVGRRATVDEIMTVAVQDRLFYEQSGGGVTLSGGEPTMQPVFGRSLLRSCREIGIHTAMETSGHAPWEVWESLIPALDMILYDVKLLDAARHRALTGVSNELILENLRRIAARGKPVVIRRPVIPGCNDDMDDIHKLARLAMELDAVQRIHLLPYHRFGRGKYERLGRSYPMGDEPSLPDEGVAHLLDILISYGLKAQIGG